MPLEFAEFGFASSSHVDTVGRVLAEVIEEGEFELVRAVNRMAHLVRVRAPAENRRPRRSGRAARGLRLLSDAVPEEQAP